MNRDTEVAGAVCRAAKDLRDMYDLGVEDGKREALASRTEEKAPVWKSGESVIHVSYADGTGGFESSKWADWTCPECGWFVGEQYIPRRHNQQKCNFCARCGQKIDWEKISHTTEEKENEKA